MRSLNVLVAPWIGPGGADLHALGGQIIQLSSGVKVDKSDSNLCGEVIKACLPRGYKYDIEQHTLLDSFYLLTKEITPNPGTIRWDEDGCLTRVLNFSRLVRTNAIGYS